MSYFIYARKSRKDADLEALGIDVLERHITTLLELAKTLSLPIGAIYREVVSGDSIDSRPVMSQVMAEVESCMWDGCLVMDVDRLARGDTIDQGRVQRAFFYSNTKIVTPNKTYDPANEYDNEYFEFSLFMSRREYATIKRRMQNEAALTDIMSEIYRPTDGVALSLLMVSTSLLLPIQPNPPCSI